MQQSRYCTRVDSPWLVAMHELAFGRNAPVFGLNWNCCVSLGIGTQALRTIATAAPSLNVRCTAVTHLDWSSPPRGEMRLLPR